ncbi:GAF domain-containing protein [Synechococcus sp. PCC 7336]|uniref:sensor histidine kinase n=1 Tax=Synechococcus sp. PCC 7336 TaxID=195250 RepID=UPI000344B6CA|nr:GAF domain-containing protein [Synechococcus sp. PCC 7336]
MNLQLREQRQSSSRDSLQPLRLLILAEASDDLDLTLSALQQASLNFKYDAADSEVAYSQLLARHHYDAVLSEYGFQGRTGTRALAVLDRSGQEIPFILMTDRLGEEIAVECLRSGVTDYVLKDRLFRLPFVLQRALQEFEQRRQSQKTFVQVHQRAQQESIVNSLLQAMLKNVNLGNVLQSTLDSLQEALQVDRCAFLELNEVGAKIMCLSRESVQRDRLLGSYCQLCSHYGLQMASGEPLAIAKFDSNIPTDIWRSAADMNVKSMLLVPLRFDGRNLGCLCLLQCDRERAWSSDRIQSVKRVADHLTVAVYQTGLHRELQALNQCLDLKVKQAQRALQFEATLKTISDRIRDSLDERQILETAVRELAIALNADCCSTTLYDLERGSCYVAYEYTEKLPTSRGEAELMADFPHCYRHLLAGQSIQFCPLVPRFNHPLSSISAVPIADDRAVMGDIWLFRSPDRTYEANEIALAQQVANQCAIAIRQAKLYQAAQAQVRELEKLSQLKDDFINTVSHELRSPLANMRVAIQMLDISRNTEKFDRYLDVLKQECRQESELIDDLLNLQRIGANCYELELEVIELPNYLSIIIETFQERIEQHDRQLICKLGDKPLTLRTDRLCLNRILHELLNNACKYTADGGSIVVELLEHPNAGISIVVGNTSSIPSEALAHIFDKFYRFNSVDIRKHGGTGLGLSLVKSMVDLLGGNISVSSEQSWTAFQLYLPQQ